MSDRVQIPAGESKENKLYNQAIRRPVNERSFFLEAGQGRNVNGNVFALLRYIKSNERFDGWEVSLALASEKFDEARQKLEKYGIAGVKLVECGSEEYRTGLARSKYLITDNSFPAYFYKRPEQVYLNTWHGTPLKVLGRTDLENAVSIANVQANMAKADWLLFPNHFTKDIMMKDFMMERVFRHGTVICDYPRNDALHRAEFRNEICERYGLEGKKVIAYMPTWRGTGRDADVEEQLAQTKAIIEELNGKLRDDEVLFVNLHFLIGKGIDLSGYDRVYGFPEEYETYDFLACCDTLVTDYSSVAIDFAGTGRDTVLFIYDYEQYRKDKGFYLDVKELPFRKAYTADELAGALHEAGPGYKLDASLQTAGTGSACEKTISLMVDGSKEGLETEDYGARAFYPSVAYFENVNKEESREALRRMEEEHPDAGERPVIMFPTKIWSETVKTLTSMDPATEFIRISGKFYCSNDEYNILWLRRKTGLFKKAAQRIYHREAMRNIGQFTAGGLEVMQGKNPERLRQLAALDK